MIPNGKGWNYLAVEKRQDGDYCCLNCIHSFRTKNKLESYIIEACQHSFFWNIVMPSEGTKILQNI